LQAGIRRLDAAVAELADGRQEVADLVVPKRGQIVRGLLPAWSLRRLAYVVARRPVSVRTRLYPFYPSFSPFILL